MLEQDKLSKFFDGLVLDIEVSQSLLTPQEKEIYGKWFNLAEELENEAFQKYGENYPLI